MKWTLFSCCLLSSATLVAQIDTAEVQRVYEHARDLSEAQVDSIAWYADYINRIALKGQYPTAKVLALRLYGWYYENKPDYKKAIDYYLQTLYEARRLGDIGHQVKALTDLAAIYTDDMKQPVKAKEVYLECVGLNKQLGDARSLLDTYINLGAIYDQIGLHDSALLFLQEGLRIGKPLEDNGKADLDNLYNNLGNNYYYRKDYDQCLVYFRNNYLHHTAQHDLPDIWTDVINMADAYSENGQFDSAGKYADLAMSLALQLKSRSKESYTDQIMSKLYRNKGEYKKAFEYQRRWYELDTALVNGETYKAIAELETKYEARERENRTLVLQSEITQQKFHNRIMMLMALSLLLIAIAAALALVTKRRVNRKLQATNDLMMRQNDRLAELNAEKNSLISIVSHDLSTPFASIGMWNQLLRSDQENLNAEQKKALSRIEQATIYGEKLIRHVLDVEKAETNQHKVELENLDLKAFAESIIEDFLPIAVKKNIRLHLNCSSKSLYFLSDKHLLSRMLENLLSNAIKYTAAGKNVWMSVNEEWGLVNIKVRDEGVGIEPDELPHLFAKYSKISSQPTNGELSTGLGLAIVKRIVEELNGQISCESAVGEGSVFTVKLKK
ncbi:MAG: tetratricopeptide repeat-containing sensor histidine kinase [Bacteroidota bacterium]|nr:tetratricopeptide repeat-containing sensor histidine kinase [Bacteroidota bacterium]MDP4215194.1 tetratricopeptide repeat-containing sensor histidine kinase [Bacteroidota bacterium]MDP4244977.1 tetratricopeptide repeat-containing sensor histidine kinase [Bacteroidota bacterium]MDP4255284.1 tetratricopeptide repeat-containing sensor histidine kinase [Bacteroidota bacterium]MDP4256716.1 tetratricopeptide repeat-containing sensor histidine kinase [Bacteroidota bacterium]